MIEVTEILQPGPAHGIAALLDVAMPGEDLPLFWHWFYLLDRPAMVDTGSDGHPARNCIPSPPEPGRRRMFAGGRIRALAPLRLGEPATRRTMVAATEEKQGRSGPLTFVTVANQILQHGRIAVEEEQDIVYREMPESPVMVAADAPVQPPAPDEWAIEITAPLLFRFSALTYNGHRIHYDRDYARDVEGYPGLLTHGPLQALAMAEAARARGMETVPGVRFEYRLVAPLFDFQGLVVRATETKAAVRDLSGRQTARATIATSDARLSRP